MSDLLKKTEEFNNTLEEVSDYKFALDESAIVAITNQKGIITHVNDNFKKISKYSQEELIGQDHQIVNSGYHSKEFIRQLWVTIANGKVWKGELKNKAKDGTFYWVDTTIVPFLNEQGKPYQYVAIRSDITKRKETENLLKESEQGFRNLVEGVKDYAIFTINIHGIVTSWNIGAKNLMGYPSEEVIGEYLSLFYTPEDVEKNIAFKNLKKAAEKGYYKKESWRVRKDGSSFFADVVYTALHDEFGNLTGFTKIVRDISERKTWEEELERKVKEISDYKYAIDESSIVAITDQKGIIMHVNDNFCKIVKYSREELIGQDHRITSSGYHSAEFIRNLWETISTGKVWSQEMKNIAKDGTFFWVDTTIVPFLNEDGIPYQYVAIQSDITERKNGEEELERKIQEISDYKYALDESSIIVFTDTKGIISHVNDNYLKISKYSREELIGSEHHYINRDHHSEDFVKDLWDTIGSGKLWSAEVNAVAKGGAPYWVDTTIIPFLDENGQPYQYLGIIFDISKRKKAEEELQRTIKEISDYKYALDESAIVAITDQKGIITHVNDNFCKISKYSREELIGQDHKIINSGYHTKEFIRDLWVTIANGNVWKGELKNKAKDGSFYWVDTTLIPFLNEQGKPYQYVAIRSDISKRKKGEEELNKYAHSLELANTQLVDFTNIVSHNLRGPLSNIAMLVDIIKETNDEDEKQEFLGDVTKLITHLNDVFEELIETVQVQQDKEIERDTIVLEECLSKILLGFGSKIKLYNADIQIDFSEVPVIQYPQKYIDSLLLNLISNAFKYKSPDRNPQISIKTEDKGETILLSVADNGIGIDLERHKDSLFKIRKTFTDHPEAKGFGLFMTKTQIETMGGTIWAESTLGVGTTFFVEIKK